MSALETGFVRQTLRYAGAAGRGSLDSVDVLIAVRFVDFGAFLALALAWLILGSVILGLGRWIISRDGRADRDGGHYRGL